MSIQQQESPLYEKLNNDQLILSKNRNNPIITKTIRTSRYLRPFAKHINQVTPLPKSPLLSDLFDHYTLKKWPFNVHFTGWNKPNKDYIKWYKKLVVNHSSVWIQAGILNAIHFSLHGVTCNKDIILGLCEFWCPKTNTFVFPWGECTITLEDVMVLGGVPCVGSNFDDHELVGVDSEFAKELGIEWENVGKRVSHRGWMEYFMSEVEDGEIVSDGVDGEGKFEHVAFLCLWLARFVLPSVDDDCKNVVKRNVIPIAIHLSKGRPIALGQVVLANIYHDLTKLTKRGFDFSSKSSVYVNGLFQIVQVWVFERFPRLVKNMVKPLYEGFPRVARWSNVDVNVSLPYVRSMLRDGEGFLWRPYACDVENWDNGFDFYEENENLFEDPCALDDCLLSFGRFLYSCELVGSGCKEIYRPQRVAMQFGYDQDVPVQDCLSGVSLDHAGFFVPAKSYEPGMSETYYEWWKDSMTHREKSVKDALRDLYDNNGGKDLVYGKHIEGKKRNKKRDRSKNVRNCVQNQIVTAPEISKTVELASPALSHSECNEGHHARQLSQLEVDRDFAGTDLDNIPLALRLSSETLIQNTSDMNDQKSEEYSGDPRTVLESLRILDLDHVPLASRLESISVKKKRSRKNSGSYGCSTGNVPTTPQKPNPYGHQTEALASPNSDVASSLSRRKGNKGKKVVEAESVVNENASGSMGTELGLLARVSKLEATIYGKTQVPARDWRHVFARY